MAFTFEQLKAFNEYWDSKSTYLGEVARLLDIYNGNLTYYLRKELQDMFKRPDGTVSSSYEQAIDRVVPINILQRVVAKQAKIYAKAPKREVLDGSDNDKEILNFYLGKMMPDRQLGIANQMFSLFNCAAVEPAASQGRYLLRPLLNSQFLPWSDDRFDPTNPTVFLVYHGMRKVRDKETRIIRAYSKDSFAIFDQNGEVQADLMAAAGSDGNNRLGELPFEYFNRKQQIQLIPTLSEDNYRMSILIPILLTDVAFSIKFQAFSILYGIDVDDAQRPFSPNVMWIFKSKDPEHRPEIGSIKPTVDSDKAVAFIQAVLAFWLQTKGIRPGSVGQLTTENFSSGISKMIDEMDTFEDRQEQVTYFSPGEENLWKRVVNVMHPAWQAAGDTEQTGTFDPNLEISVSFPEQLPMSDRGTVVDTLIKEVDTLKVESRKGALRRLEPMLSDEEIEAKLKEIDDEAMERAEKFGVPAPGEEDDDGGETPEGEDQDRFGLQRDSEAADS